MARYSKSIMLINKHLTKKGKLKGRNKKETKQLKAGCMHHKITRRGKLKPAYFIQDDQCVCRLCHHKFPAKFLEKHEVDDIFDGMTELVDQYKYLTVALNAGSAAQDFAAQFSMNIPKIKKGYKKVTNIAKKQTKIRKKKHKKYNGSSQYGSWSSR